MKEALAIAIEDNIDVIRNIDTRLNEAGHRLVRYAQTLPEAKAIAYELKDDKDKPKIDIIFLDGNIIDPSRADPEASSDGSHARQFVDILSVFRRYYWLISISSTHMHDYGVAPDHDLGKNGIDTRMVPLIDSLQRRRSTTS